VLCVSEVFVSLIIVPAALWVWFVLDGLTMLLGHPVDERGRLLRP